MKSSFYLLLLITASAAWPVHAQITALMEAPDFHDGVPALTDPVGAASPSPMAIAPAVSWSPANAASPRLHLADWSLISVASTFRVLDYTTTETCAAHPNLFHEDILPEALVHSKPGLASFEASTVVANYYAYRFLVRRHHGTMARVGQAIYDGMMGSAISINYYGINKYLH